MKRMIRHYLAAVFAAAALLSAGLAAGATPGVGEFVAKQEQGDARWAIHLARAPATR